MIGWALLGGALALFLFGDGDGAAAVGFGAAMVAAARRSLGVRERAPNSGPEIDAWLREVGLPPGSQWCAAAVSHWMLEASRATGRPAPIKGAGAAKQLLQNFRAAGRALDASQARAAALAPGTVLVWDRSDPPGSGFQGHTAIVELDAGDHWRTVEGNTANDDVRRIQRRKDDPRFLGAGLVDAPAAAAPTSPVAPGVPPRDGTVLVLGDSIGFGLARPMAGSSGHPTWNACEIGTTILQWAQRARLERAIVGTPVLALVSAGTNDIAAHADAEKVRPAIGAIVKALRANGARVGWILPPALPWPGYGVRAVLAQELSTLAVPAFETEAVTYDVAPDHVHPTSAGYAKLAKAIASWAHEQGLL